MSLAEIGERLRSRRTELGYTLRDAHLATKIQERYLAAIEAGDDSILPGHVYAKGFIRAYANFLGLDGQSLAREYDAIRRGSDAGKRDSLSWAKNHQSRQARARRGYMASLVRPAPAPRRRSAGSGSAKANTISIVLLLIFAAAAAVGMYVLWIAAQTEFPAGGIVGSDQTPSIGDNGNDQTNAIDPDGDGTASTGTEPGTETPDDQLPTGQPVVTAVSQEGNTSYYVVTAELIPVEVQVTRRCWVRVVADGTVVEETTLEPGDTRSWESRQSLTILAGYPGGIKISVAGHALDPEVPPGTPHTFVFNRESS